MGKMKKGSFLRDVLEVLIGSVIVVFVLIKFVLIPCRVDGTSMLKTLYDGDFGYSFVLTKNLGIDRFDIVVVEIDGEDEDKLLVKRVIGMPGETIRYSDNRLYVNDEYMAEEFLNSDAYTEDFEVVLADDEYYCLGDNRGFSRDSRYYGPFYAEQFVASHLFVLYPLSHFGVKK